jgi:flavorubredoxin
VPLTIFDAAHTHVSYILPSLWTQRGVMVGAPTYEGSLFPPVAQALDVVAHKRIRNKIVARFGSYGWSGGAQRHFERIIKPLKWEVADTVEFIGGPTEDDLGRGEEFGARFARLVQATGAEEGRLLTVDSPAP